MEVNTSVEKPLGTEPKGDALSHTNYAAREIEDLNERFLISTLGLNLGQDHAWQPDSNKHRRQNKGKSSLLTLYFLT